MTAVSLRWLSQGMADVPDDDAWLSPREAAWIARMRFRKRRSEFRLGRWTAKKALALYLGRREEDLAAVEIDRAPEVEALAHGAGGGEELIRVERQQGRSHLEHPPLG